MGCNCGGRKSTSGKHVFVSESGKETEYATEVEARAAKIRAGGKGTVRPK